MVRPALADMMRSVACDGSKTAYWALVAATHLSDAELWWRLADANGVLDPETLTSPVGTVVRITTQEDSTGSSGG